MKKIFKLFLVLMMIFQFAVIANFALAACFCPPGNSVPDYSVTTQAGCPLPPACQWQNDATLPTTPSVGGTCTPTVGGTNSCPVTPGTPDNTTVPAVNLNNPLGNTTTVPSLIGNVINAALGVVGSLALVMFIYGGFTWMLAAGNEQAVEKGRNILVWAAVGLVVIFASYSLVNFVISSLIKAG